MTMTEPVFKYRKRAYETDGAEIFTEKIVTTVTFSDLPTN